MLKGINVTWKPKMKKVVMLKKVGNITKSEIDEGSKYCFWRFGVPAKSYSLKSNILTFKM